MKKFDLAAISLILVSLLSSVLAVQAQSAPIKEWWSFFPTVKGCGSAVYPIHNDGSGNLSQSARYIFPQLPVSSENPVVVAANAPFLRHYECAQITISMTVPRLFPEQAKQKPEEQSRDSKLIEKLTKLYAGFYAPAPPPKKIEIKGFEAYQIFRPESDVDAESDIQTVEVRIAKDKRVRIEIYPEYGNPSALAETIDYEKLVRAMDEYASRITKLSIDTR